VVKDYNGEEIGTPFNCSTKACPGPVISESLTIENEIILQFGFNESRFYLGHSSSLPSKAPQSLFITEIWRRYFGSHPLYQGKHNWAGKLLPCRFFGIPSRIFDTIYNQIAYHYSKAIWSQLSCNDYIYIQLFALSIPVFSATVF
jgi:hypothetical protein